MDNNQKKLKNQKRTILIIMAALVIFVGLYFILSNIDFKKLFSQNDSFNSNKPIYFYDEELSKNIFQDEKYMELDRTINFAKKSWGTSETVFNDDEAVKCGPAFNTIYHMVGYIISGNHEGYNSCFSKNYYRYTTPVGRFTKQKLYNIVITEITTTDKVDEDGNPYVEYYYTLEYMIRHNNGSLRNDMGSDCVKTQHLYLSESESGEVLIDKMFTINYIQG